MKIGTKRKLGDWLLDVAKYIATAIIVASFLGEFSEQKLLYYGVGTLLIGTCLVVGFIIIDKTENKI